MCWPSRSSLRLVLSRFVRVVTFLSIASPGTEGRMARTRAKNAKRNEEGATGVRVCVEWGIGFGRPSRVTRDVGPGRRSDRESQGQARAWQGGQIQRGHEQVVTRETGKTTTTKPARLEDRGRNDYNVHRSNCLRIPRTSPSPHPPHHASIGCNETMSTNERSG